MQNIVNNFTPQKYIDKILALYPMGEREETKLHAGMDMLTEAFGNYAWHDIESAIEWYYKNRSDKTRPTIAQMKDTLVTLGVADADGTVAAPDNPFARPKTKIWSIQGDFDRMIDLFIECGVIRNEEGGYNNGRSIIDPVTDLPVLNPIQWFGWKGLPRSVCAVSVCDGFRTVGDCAGQPQNHVQGARLEKTGCRITRPERWRYATERNRGHVMKYRPSDTVHIETTYNVLRNSIITALERDTGRLDIVDEILRILSIRANRRNNESVWARNFNHTTTPCCHQMRVTRQN